VDLRVLSDNEIERFLAKTEEILADIGMRVCHPELRRLAGAAGASIDEANEIVRIPPALLRGLLATVPSTYAIAGADGREHAIGGGNQYCQSIVTDPWIVDYQSQTLRRPCLDDVRRHTIIAQKLDRVVGASRMDFPVVDVPEPASSLRALEEHLLNQGKHLFVYPASWPSYEQWLDIIEILARGDSASAAKLVTLAVAVISPLTLSEMNCELLLSACAHGFRIIPTISTMAGTTGPYAKAAMLLQGNAEAIGLAALSQMIRPGNPYLYTWLGSVTNLRSGEDVYYTLDKVLWKPATAQLGRAYDMPVSLECGGAMSYRYDQQNGAEGILFMLSAFASRPSILAGLGSSYDGISMSAEMMVIQDAWLDAAHYLAQGIATDDLHMGLESLRRAGPGGNYLMDDLTLRFLRSGEFFEHALFDYAVGTEVSSPMLQRAHERVEEMLAEDDSPLPGTVQEQLRRYFAEQYRKLGV
jgi:trimethylamine--corrinoid protein Co-methyltransferase